MKFKSILMMSVIALVGLATFTSCSDDDDKPQGPSLNEVNGYYLGEMTYEMLEITPQALAEASAVEANIADKKISFDKFPVDALITAIVGETAAPGIIAAVGDIKYSVPFEPALNSTQDAIMLTFKPEPLTISFKFDPENEEETPTVVVVGVTAKESGKFALTGKKLTFNLTVTEAKLGDVNALAGKTINLSFDMLNTVKQPK